MTTAISIVNDLAGFELTASWRVSANSSVRNERKPVVVPAINGKEIMIPGMKVDGIKIVAEQALQLTGTWFLRLCSCEMYIPQGKYALLEEIDDDIVKQLQLIDDFLIKDLLPLIAQYAASPHKYYIDITPPQPQYIFSPPHPISLGEAIPITAPLENLLRPYEDQKPCMDIVGYVPQTGLVAAYGRLQACRVAGRSALLFLGSKSMPLQQVPTLERRGILCIRGFTFWQSRNTGIFKLNDQKLEVIRENWTPAFLKPPPAAQASK